MAYIFAGCSCTAGIRKGKPPRALWSGAFACPCAAGGCSCTCSPWSGGDGGGLSPAQAIHEASSLLTSFPRYPTQSRANKTDTFLRKSWVIQSRQSLYAGVGISKVNSGLYRGEVQYQALQTDWGFPKLNQVRRDKVQC